jgi:hypothetical protein
MISQQAYFHPDGLYALGLTSQAEEIKNLLLNMSADLYT